MAKDDNLRIKVLIDSRLAEGKLGKLSKLTDKLRKDTNSATNNFIRLNQVLQTAVTTMNTLTSSFSRMTSNLMRAGRELRSMDRTLTSMQGRNVNVNVNRRNTLGGYARSAMTQPIVNNVSGSGGGFDATDALLLNRFGGGSRGGGRGDFIDTLASDNWSTPHNIRNFSRRMREEGYSKREASAMRSKGLAAWRSRSDLRMQAFTDHAARYGYAMDKRNAARAQVRAMRTEARFQSPRREWARRWMGPGAAERYQRGSSLFGAATKQAYSFVGGPTRFPRLGGIANFLMSPSALVAGGLGYGVVNVMQKTAAREQQGVKLQSLVGENFGKFLHADIEKFAARTPLQSRDIAKQVQLLSAFGIQNKNLLPSAQMIADLAIGDRMAMKTLTKVYGRVKARGTLQGEERAMAIETGRIDPLSLIAQLDKSDFAGAAIPKAFQDAEGNFVRRSVADLVEMQRKGEITFDILRRAFEKATAAGGRYNEALLKQSDTLQGRASTTLDNFNQRLADLGEVAKHASMGAMRLFNDITSGWAWINPEKNFMSNPLIKKGMEGLTKENALERASAVTDSIIKGESKYLQYDYLTGMARAKGIVGPKEGDLLGNIDPVKYKKLMKDVIFDIYTESLKTAATVPNSAELEETAAATNAGGRRSKYIQIDIGTVQAAETMNVSSDELGEETAFLTKTALYKALGSVPEIVSPA